MRQDTDEDRPDLPVEIGTFEKYEKLASALIADDRRSSERIKLNLLARCMLADWTEAPALMEDISSSGLAIRCAKRGAVGEQVVIYIDYLGRFEGTIVRTTAEGFALELHLSTYRREKLRLMLDKLTEPHSLDAARHLGWMKFKQHLRPENNTRNLYLICKPASA